MPIMAVKVKHIWSCQKRSLDYALGVLEKAVGMPYTLCRHKHDGRMTVHIPSFSRYLLRLALWARRVQTGRHL